MDCIWTEWVVANGKYAIVTSKIEESGKAYAIGIDNSIYDWVAFHCRGEGGGGGTGERREEGGRGRDGGEERGGGKGEVAEERGGK